MYVYAGYQSWIGHNKHNVKHLVLYPDVLESYACMQSLPQPVPQFDELWLQTRCYRQRQVPSYYFYGGCRLAGDNANMAWLVSDNATFYVSDVQNATAALFVQCRVNGSSAQSDLTLAQWQALSGHDVHSHFEQTPLLNTILEEIRQMVYSSN